MPLNSRVVLAVAMGNVGYIQTSMTARGYSCGRTGRICGPCKSHKGFALSHSLFQNCLIIRKEDNHIHIPYINWASNWTYYINKNPHGADWKRFLSVKLTCTSCCILPTAPCWVRLASWLPSNKNTATKPCTCSAWPVLIGSLILVTFPSSFHIP